MKCTIVFFRFHHRFPGLCLLSPPRSKSCRPSSGVSGWHSAHYILYDISYMHKDKTIVCMEKTSFMFSNLFSIFWNFNFPQSTSTLCQDIRYTTTYYRFGAWEIFAFVACTMIYEQRICWYQQTNTKKYDGYDKETFVVLNHIVLWLGWISRKILTFKIDKICREIHDKNDWRVVLENRKFCLNSCLIFKWSNSRVIDRSRC